MGALLSLPFVAFSVFRHRSGNRSTRRDGTVYGVINGLIVGCLGFVLTLMMLQGIGDENAGGGLTTILLASFIGVVVANLMTHAAIWFFRRPDLR